MDVNSGYQKTNASEPVDKREMSASDDEQKKLAMDADSSNQVPTATEPMGEIEMSGSGQEQNKSAMDVDSGDQQQPASQSVGKRYVTSSLIILTTAKKQTTEVDN